MMSPDDWCSLQSLAAEYWQRVDRVSDAPVDELYVDSGSMHIGTAACEGRPEIRRFFEQRTTNEVAAKRTTRHSASLLAIDQIAPNRFRIHSTVTVIAGNGEWPMQSAPPATVGDFEDFVVRTPEGKFLFESRKARIVFVGAGAATFARQ